MAFHVVTVSGTFSVKQVPMLLSAYRLGYAVTVLGMGNEHVLKHGGKGVWGRQLGWKLNAIHQFIIGVADDDVVLFADAYDVLFVNRPSVLLDKFMGLVNRTGKTIWISAEESPGFRAADHPGDGVRWRYLNSGCMMGLGSGWKLLLREPPPYLLPQRYVGDQDWIIDVFLNTSALGGRLGLDTGCELFQATCRVGSSAESHPACPASNNAVDLQDGQVINVVTSTHPSLLHLVGPGHWPLWHQLETVLGTPRRSPTCHYYEVARQLMPEVLSLLEADPIWNYRPYIGVCTSDSIAFHVWWGVVLSHAGIALLLLGPCAYALRAAVRYRRAVFQGLHDSHVHDV